MSRWQSYWLQYVWISTLAAGAWLLVFGWFTTFLTSGEWIGWLITLGGAVLITTYVLFWSINDMIDGAES